MSFTNQYSESIYVDYWTVQFRESLYFIYIYIYELHLKICGDKGKLQCTQFCTVIFFFQFIQFSEHVGIHEIYGNTFIFLYVL